MGKRSKQSKTPQCPEYLHILQYHDGRNAWHKKKVHPVEKVVISLEGAELERVLDLLLSSAEPTATLAVKLEIARSDGESDASQDFLP